MSHTTVDEEAAGRAALHALGALEGDEAREFAEHLAAGCAACPAASSSMVVWLIASLPMPV